MLSHRWMSKLIIVRGVKYADIFTENISNLSWTVFNSQYAVLDPAMAVHDGCQPDPAWWIASELKIIFWKPQQKSFNFWHFEVSERWVTGLGTVLCFTSVAASIAVASLLSRFDKVFGLLMNGMLVFIFSKCEGLRWDEEWDLLSWFFSFLLLPSLSLQLWLWKVNEYLTYITWWRFHGFQAHFVSRCHLRIRLEQLQTLSLSSSPSWHKVMLRSGRSSGPKSVSVLSVLFSSSFLQLQPCPGLLPNHLWVVSWDLLPC